MASSGKGWGVTSSEVGATTLMEKVYLKLLRTEILRQERRGGYGLVDKLLRALEPQFAKPEFLRVLLLERARIAYYLGRWDDCLTLLDQVQIQESELEVDDRALLYLVSGRLHQGYGDLHQALMFYETAWQTGQAGQGGRAVEALLEMGSLFHRIGEHERGNDFLGQAEDELKAAPERRLASRLAFEKGLVAVREDRLDEAQNYFKYTVTCLKEKNPSVTRGEGLRFLGILAAMDGRPNEALKFQREALLCFRALTYPLGQAKTYNSLGQTCLQLGRHQEALFFLQQALALCRQIGAEAEVATVLGKLGMVLARQGDYDRAIEYQRQDLEISTRFGNFRALAFSLRNLGLSHRAKGDLKEAVGYLRDSRDRFAELEDRTFLIKADLDLAEALLDHDRVMEAFGYLEDAQALLEGRLDVTADHIDVTYFMGLVYLGTDNLSKAENYLWQALEMSQALALQGRQADVHYFLAKLYIAKNDRSAALEELRLAYRLARAYSRTERVYQVVELLHQIEPDAVFAELSRSANSQGAL